MEYLFFNNCVKCYFFSPGGCLPFFSSSYIFCWVSSVAYKRDIYKIICETERKMSFCKKRLINRSFTKTIIIESLESEIVWISVMKANRHVMYGSTGKSLSEVLILASTNPQYDKILSIELPVLPLVFQWTIYCHIVG